VAEGSNQASALGVIAGGGGGLRAGEVEPRRAWRGQCQQPRQDALGPAPTGWRGSELARTGPDMPGARRSCSCSCSRGVGGRRRSWCPPNALP